VFSKPIAATTTASSKASTRNSTAIGASSGFASSRFESSLH
jgi:hypothetical protein